MKFVKFEDVKVWQEGRELVKALYALTRQDCFIQAWWLNDRVRRVVVSVTINIVCVLCAMRNVHGYSYIGILGIPVLTWLFLKRYAPRSLLVVLTGGR